MKVVKATTFRQKMKSYMDAIQNSSEVIIIPRDDEDAVVVMSLKEYNSLTDTGYLLSTENNRKRLK